MRAFIPQNLTRIYDFVQFKVNHLKEVVSHLFSLLWVLIVSASSNRTHLQNVANLTNVMPDVVVMLLNPIMAASSKTCVSVRVVKVKVNLSQEKQPKDRARFYHSENF